MAILPVAILLVAILPVAILLVAILPVAILLVAIIACSYFINYGFTTITSIFSIALAINGSKSTLSSDFNIFSSFGFV